MSSWTDQIEADLSWREAELGSLKMAAAAAPKGSDRQRALLRALWTMLYAHYEGFFKFCWDLFLSEVERVGCKRKDAAHCIVLLSLSNVFKKLRGDTSADQIWSFIHNTLPTEMECPVVFPNRLETRSNLWPNLAKENNALIGISTGQVDAYAPQLSALVGRRNEIAHGKKLVVDSLDEYAVYEKAVMIVLHEVAVQIVDHLERGDFLLQPIQHPVATPATPPQNA